MAFSIIKSTPPQKKYTTVGCGGCDKYELWTLDFHPSSLPVFFYHRQSGLNISAEASGQGISVVDSRSEIQGVQNSNKEEIKETSGDHFKDLSKTSSKNFYPEVVTERSLEVKLFWSQTMILYP